MTVDKQVAEPEFANDKPAGGTSVSHRYMVLTAQALIAFLLVGGWEFSSGRIVDDFWFSRPSLIALRLVKWTMDGSLVWHSAITLYEILLGFAVGFLPGVLTGIVLASNDFVARLLNPFIIVAYSIPLIALTPLMVLWFGLSVLPKIVIVAIVVYFIIFFNVFAGVKGLDRNVIDSVRLMGATSREVLWKVILPGTVAWTLAGVRIAMPYSIVAAIVGEFIASREGLGWLITATSGALDATGIFVSVLVLTGMGIVFDEVAACLENWLLRWRGTTVGIE